MIGAIAIMSWKVKSVSVLGAVSQGETISLSTEPSPLRLGQATFIIEIRDTDGKPVDNATVSYDLNMSTMNMGTQQGNATSKGRGRYTASGSLSMRGPWRVRAKVIMPDGSMENKDFIVNVP